MNHDRFQIVAVALRATFWTIFVLCAAFVPAQSLHAGSLDEPLLGLDGFLRNYSFKGDGGNSGGGGGNGVMVAHPSPAELRTLYSEKKILLIQFLSQMQSALLKENAPGSVQDSLATKMYSDNLLSSDYQEIVAASQIEFDDKDACYNKDGLPKLGSIFPRDRTKDICLSSYLIAQAYNWSEAPAQLLGLALHESYHLLRRRMGYPEGPAEEVEAEFIQGQFIARYERMNANLRQLQEAFDKRIKVWLFPIGLRPGKDIKRSEAFELCLSIQKLVTADSVYSRSRAGEDKGGKWSAYDALPSALEDLGLLPARTIQESSARLTTLVKKLAASDFGGSCDYAYFQISGAADEFDRLRAALMADVERFTGIK